MDTPVTEAPPSLCERLALAKRVAVDSYYTDGRELYEVEAVGPTGCVVIQNSVNGHVRCLSIDTFRRYLWLVRGARDLRVDAADPR